MKTSLLVLGLPASIIAFHIPPLLPTPIQTTTQRFSSLPTTSTDQLGSSDVDTVDTKPQRITTEFDSFDYESQWYPVIWAVDVPLDEPVRVTLLDVHYVVWKTIDDHVSGVVLLDVSF
jgi:hypothetical protein